MAPSTIACPVENHAIGCFLQRTKSWHGCAAPCPCTATICYPQRCNCLAAFAFRFDRKPCRTSICTEVELLILGWHWSRRWRRCRLQPANWSQVMAPRTTASPVENHGIGCFLQRTELWHVWAAPCPWTATTCYPQRCNCLTAFAFRFNLKPCRTSICTEVEHLIHRSRRRRLRRRLRRHRLRRHRLRHWSGHRRRCGNASDRPLPSGSVTFRDAAFRV